MTSIGRVDQAILLLKDRLEKLNRQGNAVGANKAAPARADSGDAIQMLRNLVRQGALKSEELRKAFVRTLLAESLGDQLVGNLEFIAVADQVWRMLEESEQGRDLLARALGEVGLE